MIDARRRPPTTRREWPMTSTAADALRTEIALLEHQLSTAPVDVTGPAVDPAAGRATAARKLDALLELLEAARIVDEPVAAVIGRRATVTDVDGGTESYALVLPGDGDPIRGWVSIDSPLGAAIAGRRVGERATVVAPGGPWTVTLTAVE